MLEKIDTILINTPRWVWALCLFATLAIGAWLRTRVFKIPPDEPYKDM